MISIRFEKPQHRGETEIANLEEGDYFQVAQPDGGGNFTPLTIPGHVDSLPHHQQKLIRHNWALAARLDELWILERSIAADQDLLNSRALTDEIRRTIATVEREIRATTRDILEYYADF